MRLLSAVVVLALPCLALAQTPTGKPAKSLLTPQNSAILFIDHQPQMAFATGSIDRATLINNSAGLAKAAKSFNVPVVLTTAAEKTFAGPIFSEIQSVFPDVRPIDRTTMNAWEDKAFLDAVKKTGRKKLVVAGLWTEVCIVLATLSALDEGYEVYVVTDASGGTTKEAHDMGVLRMVQAGVRPVTWLQVLLEYQRDWARQATYGTTTDIAKEHAGAYGLGIRYAHGILHAHEGQAK